MEVGNKIRKYLEEHGITQAHISREAKIDAVKLNLSLNGNRRFTFEEYATICGVLGVNTDYFLKPRMPDAEKTK